ncbi:hypothetical protein [Salinibaculum salinum]|uniref:hypothetical protein n=1 Tax=Salinibaculum salinum TaxID=3131996 RepID=UPI0030EF4894
MVLPLAAPRSVPWLVVVLFAGALLVGLAFLGTGLLSLWRWRVLSRGDANQFRAGLDGLLEVTGPAAPTDESTPFTAAVSRTACLVCEIQAQKYETSQHGGSWNTIESRTTVRPFVVDSPVGDIRVEPDGANLVLDEEVVASVGRGEEATGHTAAFFDAVGVEHRAGSLDVGVTDIGYGSKYRVREARVDVGEDVYVAGHATTDDETVGGYGGPDAVVREQADRSVNQRLFGFPFVLGDGGEATIRRHFLRRGVGLTLAGLLFVGVPAGIGFLLV